MRNDTSLAILFHIATSMLRHRRNQPIVVVSTSQCLVNEVSLLCITHWASFSVGVLVQSLTITNQRNAQTRIDSRGRTLTI